MLFICKKTSAQRFVKTDTIKAQLLITTIDSSKTAYLQIPVFARNGFIVVYNNKIIRYLDWYKKPLTPDEIVWEIRETK